MIHPEGPDAPIPGPDVPGGPPPLTARPRLPRLTLGRALALMVPVAAYLALARQIMGHGINGPLVAVLLALCELLVASRRRLPFLGAVVQVTTGPLAILALLGIDALAGSPIAAYALMACN